MSQIELNFILILGNFQKHDALHMQILWMVFNPGTGQSFTGKYNSAMVFMYREIDGISSINLVHALELVPSSTNW